MKQNKGLFAQPFTVQQITWITMKVALLDNRLGHGVILNLEFSILNLE